METDTVAMVTPAKFYETSLHVVIGLNRHVDLKIFKRPLRSQLINEGEPIEKRFEVAAAPVKRVGLRGRSINRDGCSPDQSARAFRNGIPVQRRPFVCRWMRSSLGIAERLMVCNQRRKNGLPNGSPEPVM